MAGLGRGHRVAAVRTDRRGNNDPSKSLSLSVSITQYVRNRPS